MVKNPPAMLETWVRSPGWEEPPEEDVASHPSILAWRIPMDRGTWGVTVHGGCKEQDMTEKHSTAQQIITNVIIELLTFSLTKNFLYF